MKESGDFEKNIISWYPFKENSDILEIKNEFEFAKSVLSSSVNVTTCETKKESFHSFNQSKKWDYITLLGSLEESINCFQNAEELLLLLKEVLKENGKILIAADNKFGISNWIAMENKIAQKNYFSKKELDDLFHKAHFEYVKYYYPLPNYQEANVIYTDTMLPNVENISRNLTLYKEQEIINGNPTSIYQEIIKNNENDFPFFANSFFIELGNSSKDNNEVQFVSFSNLRKKEYRIQTVITKDKVFKTALTGEAEDHIQEMKKNIDILKEMGFHTLDSYNDNKIISNYVTEQSLDKVIIGLLNENKKEECFSLIERFKHILLNIPEGKSENSIFEKYNVKIEKEKKEKLHFLQHGLWDLNFQNCFFIQNEFYFYDQEWYDENVPIEYILYRTIIYLPSILEHLTKEEWMKKLNIQDFQEEFQELDDKIQENIRDEEIWKAHTSSLEVTSLKENFENAVLLNLEKDNHIFSIEQDNKAKQEYILSLEKQREELIVSLEYEKQLVDKIINSTSWKITEPIRKITKHLKNKERKEIK